MSYVTRIIIWIWKSAKFPLRTVHCQHNKHCNFCRVGLQSQEHFSQDINKCFQEDVEVLIYLCTLTDVWTSNTLNMLLHGRQTLISNSRCKFQHQFVSFKFVVKWSLGLQEEKLDFSPCVVTTWPPARQLWCMCWWALYAGDTTHNTARDWCES